MPAHRVCNGELAKDDEFFRDVLVAIRGVERHPEASDLIEGRVKRSYESRPHLLAQHLQRFALRPVLTPSGLYLGHAQAFEADPDRMDRILGKIARGLFYTKRRRPLASSHVVEWFHLSADNLEYTQAVVSRMTPFENFGDTVFRYRHYLSERDQDASAWFLVFYDAIAFVARTVLREISQTA